MSKEIARTLGGKRWAYVLLLVLLFAGLAWRGA